MPAGAHTLAKAMSVYMAQLSPGKHADNQADYVAELLRWFGPSQLLMEIPGRLQGKDGYLAWARKQPVRAYVGGNRKKAEVNPAAQWKDTKRLRTDSTINRYLDCLRRAIRLYGSPIDPATDKPRMPALPAIPKLKEPKRRPRPVPDGDLERILEHATEHLVDAATLWRQMGFRRTELLRTPLADVDLEHEGIWLRAEDTKGDADEFVPANRIAMEVLRRRYAEAERLGIPWLFWYVPPAKRGAKPKAPQPIKDMGRAWAAAQKRAGIKRRYRIHDLKASFLTAAAPHSDARTLQRLGRHADFATTQAYLEVLDARSRAAVDAMAEAQLARKSVRDSVRETGHQSAPLRPQKAKQA